MRRKKTNFENAAHLNQCHFGVVVDCPNGMAQNISSMAIYKIIEVKISIELAINSLNVKHIVQQKRAQINRKIGTLFRMKTFQMWRQSSIEFL